MGLLKRENKNLIFVYDGFRSKSKTKIISGIYIITNLINGKFYISSSNNIYDRLVHHKNSLKRQKHHNIYLQRSVNKYGINKFKFELLVEVFNTDLNYLKDLEQRFLNCLHPEYNICKEATNNRQPLEVLEKISQTLSKVLYLITFPDGELEYCNNLNRFCKNNNLSQSNMQSVASKRVSSCKGFKCEYIINPYKNIYPNL